MMKATAQIADLTVTATNPTYTLIDQQENVLVKIPKASLFMKPKTGFTTTDGTQVPKFWKNGKPLKSGRILNVCYYGITTKDLGKKTIATVKVIKKTTADGRPFAALDIIVTRSAPAANEMKIHEDDEGKLRIEFNPRHPLR